MKPRSDGYGSHGKGVCGMEAQKMPIRVSGVRFKSAVVVTIAFASFGLGVIGSTESGGQERQPEISKAQPMTSLKEITALIQELRNSDKSARQRAYEQLLEIGPAVPAELSKHSLGNDPDAVRWAMRLITEIQAKHGIQSVRMNGLEFQTVTDLIW